MPRLYKTHILGHDVNRLHDWLVMIDLLNPLSTLFQPNFTVYIIYLCPQKYCPSRRFGQTLYLCRRSAPTDDLFRPYGPTPAICRPIRGRILTFASFDGGS